eukprot:TRINITY_DN63492_c0_g1_i1.p1 TRINITY_DN63492_c0_g1~~TRINITY_DN63492_c0_g1_i1.p1  ORF type:complete len:353 (-),score=17.84 TRINITY_DN63492_c0_g1_i1:301-1359(-)
MLRLAILIVGCLDRLEIASKLKYVAGPAVRDGFEVDLFIDLTASWNRIFYDSYPAPGPGHFADHSEAELRNVLEDESRRVGINSVSLVLHDKPVEVDTPDPERVTLHCNRDHVMHTCINDLRRFKQFENSWKRASNFRGPHGYSHVMAMQEQVGWYGNVDLLSFPMEPLILYSTFCKARVWHLVWDRIFLMGPEAANRFMLMYTQYFDKDERYRPLIGTTTTEDFHYRIALINNLTTIQVSEWEFPWMALSHIFDGNQIIQCARYAYTFPCPPADTLGVSWLNSSNVRPLLRPTPCHWEKSGHFCGRQYLPWPGCLNFGPKEIAQQDRKRSHHTVVGCGSRCLWDLPRGKPA